LPSQLADWRLRPLPADMQHYARVDTHYLLYMHDRLKELLAQKGPHTIHTVLNASRDVCMKMYQKEVHTETSYLAFYQNADRQYTGPQLAVLAALYGWRDRTARSKDESPGYVLPRAVLLRLCDAALTVVDAPALRR
jgi:exosome complex exonuclease RRP6